MSEHPRLLGKGHCYFHDCWGSLHQRCRFCAVGTVRTPPDLDPEEPRELADAVKRMGLSYAVITVVNRDDLLMGASITRIAFREFLRLIRVGLELLCSDLMGT